MSELTFSINEDERRYEAKFGDALAGYTEFSLVNDDTTVLLVHTEVMPAHEGKGVGSALARHVLDAARDAGRQVIPGCEFMAGYVRKHPDYWALMSDGVRRALKI